MSKKDGIIKSIIKESCGQKATGRIWEILNEVFDKDKADMTIQELNVYLILTYIMEVHSGGFERFFEYSGGDYTQGTLIALKDVKSVIFKDLFEKAVSEFPNSYVPKDMFERRRIKENIENKAAVVETEHYPESQCQTMP